MGAHPKHLRNLWGRIIRGTRLVEQSTPKLTEIITTTGSR